MTKRVELQIQGSTTFTFDVEGQWLPSWRSAYKDAADPNELIEIRAEWEFQRCRIRSSDGTTATLWAEFLAFRARLEDRNAHPTWVRLVRDPDGAAEVLITLGPPDYEQFQINEVAGELDPNVPDASYNTTATFTLRVSAARRFADANGIVGFDQQVRYGYEGGRRSLEWITRITTIEGTSAVEKAKTFGSIPVAELGGDHSYITNGPDGIEYRYTDADEENSRTATVCEVVSKVQQWGISVGVTAGGASPSEFAYGVATNYLEGGEVETVYTASAVGPGAYNWVLSKEPSSFKTAELFNEQARLEASGRWVQKADRDELEDNATTRRLAVSLTGGKPVQRWDTIANGLPPIEHVGGITPLVATVEVLLSRRGTNDPKAFAFPGLLKSPWRLDYNASEETEPELVEVGKDEEHHRYERKARLVYKAATKPTKRPLEELEAATPVESYFL